MTAEGWNGKSIREHVEHAEAEAGRAVELAEEVETQLDNLRRDLGARSKPNARQVVIEALPIAAPIAAVSADDLATLFCKVKVIRQEIAAWNAFKAEVRGVREAIAEWRRLDAKLIAPVLKGGRK